jgi:hypothetical protein
MSKRRTHSPEFNAWVAMEAISGPNTIQEIAADHATHSIGELVVALACEHCQASAHWASGLTPV